MAPRGGAAFQLNSYWGTLVVRRAWAGRYAEALALGERVVARLPAPSAGPGLDYLCAWFVCDAYLGLGVAHAMLGRPAAAQRAFAEARAAAHLVANPFLLGAVTEQELKLLALAYRPEQVVARRRLAAEVAEALGRAGSMGMVTPRLFCVPLLVLEGAWAEARALALTGRTAGHNAGVRELAMGALGWLAREQGEPELAWAQVREVLPDGPATTPGSHFIGLEAPPLARLAAALAVDAGDPAMARAWLEMHDRWLAWSGAVLGQAAGQLGWAAYHRAAGDLAPAREHAGRALAGASEPRQPLALLAAHRFLGELDTAAGQHAEAQAHLDHALALTEACAAPYERALTLLALAELRAATGDAPGARAVLEEACTICTPLGAQPALARAVALEARLAAPTPTAASPAYPAGLTPREVEVLRLVAQGLSDAEVAARLYISVHTVKTHLRATYGKLAVASRSAATRVALEYGLA